MAGVKMNEKLKYLDALRYLDDHKGESSYFYGILRGD